MTSDKPEWLFEDSPSLILVLNESLVCEGMASVWRERLEPKLSNNLSIPATELFDFDSNPELLNQLHAVLDGKPIANTPVGLRLADQILPSRLGAWRAQQDNNDDPCIMVAATDVSLYRKAIDELTQLHAQRSLILGAAGEGIYGLDADGCVTFGNAAAEAIIGWKTEKILGQKAHDVHHHSHGDGSPYPRDDCPIYASLTDGEVHHVANEVFWHADGSAVPVEYTSTPILKDGKPNGAVVVFRDISKRLEMERQQEAAYIELTNLKMTYQLILDSAGEGIHGLDRDGKITFGNAAAETILGWKTKNVLGQKSHDVHHHSHPDGSHYPRADCPIYAALKDGETHHVDDEVFWHSDGSAIPVEYTSTPIIKEGSPDGAVVVFRDISERKKLQEQRDTAFEEIKQLKDRLEQERDYLREEININSNFSDIIGSSNALKRTLAQIESVASTPVNVLVLGESGVGKEMIARAIHIHSDRADKPLVKVNCASIPEDLFESEFFGHVKGAFTGAHKDRIGRLQLAAGGTLFLDEVGEIPMSQQGKLLRALQEHEFERVGDDQTIKVDVRVVAATNRDLSAEVKAGRFREDLFYRLSVFPVEVPALRERMEDIAPLASHFLSLIGRDLGRDEMQLTKQQLSMLKSHDWPGNIRELKNVIERAVILSSGVHLRLDLALPNATPDITHETTELMDDADFLTDAEFRNKEKSNMIAVLKHTKWKVWGDNGAAELLGIKASTFTHRMKMFGIQKETK